MSAEVAETEKRRVQRIALPLPTRVEVKIDGEVSWNEVTRLTDVSPLGAGFSLKRPLKRGRIVQLTVPMPRQLRSFDFTEPQYRIWSIVRRCVPAKEPNGEMRYAIGVAFVGKNPPAGFNEDPAILFEISHREDDGLWHITKADENPDDRHLGKGERRQTRFCIPEELTVEVLNADGNIIANETSVTENISLGGACLFTSLKADVGSFVRVISNRHNVTIIAVVRGRRTGPDGLTRLHVEFIDNFFPLDGIE